MVITRPPVVGSGVTGDPAAPKTTQPQPDSPVTPNTDAPPVSQDRPTDVYFSPNGGIQKRIIDEIDKAKSGIDIAIFSFTSDKVARALAKAKKRGVSIRLIMDSENTKEDYSQWSYLTKNGFNMKLLSGKKRYKKDEAEEDKWGDMHNKFIIFDGNSDNRLLMTGSYNISESAEKYNHENALFISDKSVIQTYQEMFEKLWAKEK